MNKKNVLFIGGDKRISYAAARMAETGYAVTAIGLIELPNSNYKPVKPEKYLDAVAGTEVLFLPLPCSRDGKTVVSQHGDVPNLLQIAAALNPAATVYGGMLPAEFVTLLQDRGIAVQDYYLWDYVTAANGVPTAYGVLRLLLENTEKTLDNTVILVTGYGRSGKLICCMLSALGAEVIAFARSGGDRALATGMGICCLPFSALEQYARTADFIVNTVPASVITASVIGALPTSACIIDIASAPFGTDFKTAEQAGIRALQAGSLPGKAAPQSAGWILADAVMCHLRGEEID